MITKSIILQYPQKDCLVRFYKTNCKDAPGMADISHTGKRHLLINYNLKNQKSTVDYFSALLLAAG